MRFLVWLSQAGFRQSAPEPPAIPYALPLVSKETPFLYDASIIAETVCCVNAFAENST